MIRLAFESRTKENYLEKQLYSMNSETTIQSNPEENVFSTVVVTTTFNTHDNVNQPSYYLQSKQWLLWCFTCSNPGERLITGADIVREEAMNKVKVLTNILHMRLTSHLDRRLCDTPSKKRTGFFHG